MILRLIWFEIFIIIQTPAGQTALHESAKFGHLEMVKLLIRNRAKICANNSGETPLLAAATKGHLSVFDYLIRIPRIDRQERIDGLELIGSYFVNDVLIHNIIVCVCV